MLYLDHSSWLQNHCFDEPGQTEAHEDVKDITPDGVTHGHIPVTILDNTDAPQRVGNTDTSSDEGEPHDIVGDAECEANHSDHPDHNIAVEANPDNGDEEGGHIHVLFIWLVTVWDGVDTEIVEGEGDIPAEHRPLTVIQGQGLDQGILPLLLVLLLPLSHLGPILHSLHLLVLPFLPAALPGVRHWQALGGPGLYGGVESHEDTVEDVQGDEKGCLVPRDHPVGDGGYQNNHRDEVAEAVSAHAVPVEGNGVAGAEGAHTDHQGDVEHGAPHHPAHTDVVLGHEHPDHSGAELRGGAPGAHKGGARHVGAQAKHVRHPLQGGDKILIADDSEPDEHVNSDQDVEEDSSVSPHTSAKYRAGELLDCWLCTRLLAPIARGDQLYPGDNLLRSRGRCSFPLSLQLITILSFSMSLLVHSQKVSLWCQ